MSQSWARDAADRRSIIILSFSFSISLFPYIVSARAEGIDKRDDFYHNSRGKAMLVVGLIVLKIFNSHFLMCLGNRRGSRCFNNNKR